MKPFRSVNPIALTYHRYFVDYGLSPRYPTRFFHHEDVGTDGILFQWLDQLDGSRLWS